MSTAAPIAASPLTDWTRWGWIWFNPRVSEGINVFDGQEVMEHARSVKSGDEIAGMTHALAVCDGGMARMREALRPGMTENALWALLHETNIRQGGEFIETRCLASGGRTNPWFQECSDRVIRPGDLVAFDTDMIGPMGFCCDISRTFHTGPGQATGEQRRLYGLAIEQVQHNLGLLKAGISFREISEKSFTLPPPMDGDPPAQRRPTHQSVVQRMRQLRDPAGRFGQL